MDTDKHEWVCASNMVKEVRRYIVAHFLYLCSSVFICACYVVAFKMLIDEAVVGATNVNVYAEGLHHGHFDREGFVGG